MAFGGVPTGIINARLAPRVKVKHNWKISYPDSFAKLAMTGTKIVTSAKFDMTSEANTEITTTMSTMAGIDMCS